MKIIISEEGKLELDRLEFNIVKVIDKILGYIPKRDILRLSHILVTDLPSHRKKDQEKCMASYFKKMNNQRPFIALYLRNLFGHIKSSESFRQMVPIQELGIAETIYHEIGHHVRDIRSHGIGRHKSEHFAEAYTKEMMTKYILDNAKRIDSCFDHLESRADSRGLSVDIITKMRVGWDQTYKEAISPWGGVRNETQQ